MQLTRELLRRRSPGRWITRLACAAGLFLATPGGHRRCAAWPSAQDSKPVHALSRLRSFIAGRHRRDAARPPSADRGLSTALKGFERALRAANHYLQPASGLPLSEAVNRVVEAVKDAPREEHLRWHDAKAVRRSFGRARGRLARAVAAAQRSGDLTAARDALEAAAVLGEAVTELAFVETVQRRWTLWGESSSRREPVLWRGLVVDSAALEGLAEATLQMDIARLLGGLRPNTTGNEVLKLLDGPLFLAEVGFDLVARAQGHDVNPGRRTLLLRRAEMMQITALIAHGLASGHGGSQPLAGLTELVRRATELCQANSNALGVETKQLTELLRRLPSGWKSGQES